jgi:hypothetical protein
MGAGLCLCLYLFFTLKMEISALEQRGKARETAYAESISSIRASLDGARERIREVQEQTGMLVQPAPTRSGLNLSKRGQVLQLHRRGQSPEQISTSLGLPLTEIDLLIKVHQIVLDQIG